jgi:bifunctional non-homologous end joining protein LigD
VSAFTRFITPCQPVLRTSPPRGAGWSHEIKFDGWRLQLHKVDAHVRLLSRHGHDLTSRLPAIACALAEFNAKSVILDGELVALSDNGLPDFRALHRRLADAPLLVWIFDVLDLNGRDVRPLSLAERRHLLAQQLATFPPDSALRFSEGFADPARLLAAVNNLGLEGIVSKRLDAAYRSGRRPEWVKTKTESWRIANRERWRLFEKAASCRLIAKK